ncbi:hypothetical protein BsWGS_07576 [Bradybaena similaris]
MSTAKRISIFSGGSALFPALTHSRSKSDSKSEDTENDDAKSAEVDYPMQTTEVEPAESLSIVEEPDKPWYFCRPPKREDIEAYAEYKKYKSVLIHFVFSHVGLTSLVIGYIVMGGVIFQYLEGKSEIVERATITKKRNATVTRVWLMTVDLNVLEQGNWSSAVEQILKDFQDELVVAVRKRGWDGRDEFNKDISWSFFGAMLYCVTVITTIGYGHITTKTKWGRLTTILYAILGIPLSLLCLSTIGSSWANCFRFMYKYVSLHLESCSSCHRQKDKKRGRSIFREALNTKGVTVPLWVSLLIIGSYICGGALLFSSWEKDWDYLIAAYFCFITLTTIGFGDYVFGSGTQVNNNAKLITSSLYLFMGLAIIAMCFSLMQEEVKSRFMRIGLKLGLMKTKPKKKRRRHV